VIRPGVEAWASGLTKREASSALASHGVAAGPVNSAADIMSDPHVEASGLVHRFEVEGREAPVDVVGSPLRFLSDPRESESEAEGTADASPVRWPRLGQQTESVLKGWLGLSPDAIARLREEEIVR